jgi:hypothetical protein
LNKINFFFILNYFILNENIVSTAQILKIFLNKNYFPLNKIHIKLNSFSLLDKLFLKKINFS